MIEQEKTRRTAMEKEYLSANLRMLQAQIEPHFLFNTLSNILSLIDTRPDKGKSMLLDLTKYLRTSLSRTLPEKTTLSQEISMIKAYLNIQKIRMDDRLNYKIDVPDNIWQHYFPANAVCSRWSKMPLSMDWSLKWKAEKSSSERLRKIIF